VNSAERRAKLDAEAPAAAAAAPILLPLLTEIERLTQGTLDDRDPECLHDLRVALRRTRCAAKLLRNLLPPELAELRAELRALARVSGPVRDADVRLLRLAALRRRLPERLHAGLDAIAERVTAERRVLRRELERALDSPRQRQRSAAWRKELAQPPTSISALRTRELAVTSVERLLRRVLSIVRRYSDSSDPAELHELRVRCKQLRYGIEAFRSLYSKRADRALATLAELQEALGDFHDCEVQIAAFAALQAELERERGSVLAIEAAGAIVGELQRRRSKALARSEERLERLSSAKALRKLRSNLEPRAPRRHRVGS
jgi:CHAD domain-containing protein